MQGKLDKLVVEQGKGVVNVSRYTGRDLLGAVPGASTRLGVWLGLTPASNRVEKALLTLGFEAPKDATPPFKVKFMVDRSGIARELKPQLSVELEDTIYYKVAYDVKPLLAGKLGRWHLHKALFYYDMMSPLIIRDLSLVVVYNVENVDARYSFSMLTGGRTLEPGEVTVEYPPFYDYMGGQREASLIIHSPSTEAEFEVVVAGSSPRRVTGFESTVLTMSFDYRGSLIPVSVRYLEGKRKYYPRKAVITDLYLLEQLVPKSSLSVSIDHTEFSGGKIKVSISIFNNGESIINNIIVSLMGLGARLARKKIGTLKPGETRNVTFEADLSRMPVRPSRLIVLASGTALGRRVEATGEINF